MKVDVLFASVPVKNLERSKEWYRHFFGRPPDIVPNEHEVMWRTNEGAWVYVIDDADRAGHTVITVAVPDLDAAVASFTSRGIDAGPIEPVGDAGRKAFVFDPDGNSVAVVQISAL